MSLAIAALKPEVFSVSNSGQSYEEKRARGKSRRPSYFLRAASWGNEEVIEEVLQAGGDIHEVDEKGETALHKAIRFGQLKVATVLVEKGCDVNLRDNLGMTPLHWAAMCGHSELTRILLLHDADVFACDYYAGGMTPLGVAQLMGATAVQDMLEQHVETAQREV